MILSVQSPALTRTAVCFHQMCGRFDKNLAMLAALLTLSLAPAGAQDNTPPVAPPRGNTIKGAVESLSFTVPVSTPGAPIQGFVDNTDARLPASRSRVVKPEVFRAWVEKNHPGLSARITSDDLIVEVAGQWDHADKTLKSLGLGCRHIRARALDATVLEGARVVIVNCAGEIKRDKLQLLRDFVSRGGYLLTTDWALDNMLQQTFPNTIVWNKGVNHKPVYEADFVSPDPVLARGCVRRAHWKLDQSAHLIRVLDKSRVRVLVESPALASEDPDRAGVLAVLFPFGRGQVLHMAGHFDNNAAIAVGNFLPDASDEIGISLRQALATNFIAAAVSGEKPQ